MADKKKQTLDGFLISMTSQIEGQQRSVMEYGTTLVDLAQELKILIEDLIAHAIESRKDFKDALDEITAHNKNGTIPEDDDSLIEKAWVAKGQVDGYLYGVTHLRDLCKDVLGRKDATKH